MNDEVTDRPVTPEGAFHLPDRDRLILAAICLLALVVMAMAGWPIVDASLHFFGEHATEREDALAARSPVVIPWALFTPFFAWSLLRGHKEALWIAPLWVLLFLFSTPWWWPPAPSDAFDAVKTPVWYGGKSVFPWTLLAGGLGTGILAAWRSGQQALFIGAVIASIGVATFGGLSFLELKQHEQDERLEVTAEAQAELDVLAADPLWTALPAVESNRAYEIPRYTDHDGTEIPTTRSVSLGSVGDMTLFRQIVAAAESAGWALHSSLCIETTVEGRFVKELSVGPAWLQVRMASHTPGVTVYATVGPVTIEAAPTRCWENLVQ